MADLQEHPNATGLGWADGMGQELPHATGLGWADGTGLGQQHATHNTFGFWFIDLYRLTNVPGPTVGWMGQAWDIEYNTQHSATTLLAPWLGRWDGPGSSTHNSTTQPGLIRVWPHGWVDGTGLEDHIFRRDNIPGPMVGWLGWAWDNSTQLDNTTHADNFSGPMDSHTGLASWLGGWDGPGRPYYIYLLRSNTRAYSFSNKPGPGWVAGTGLGRSCRLRQHSTGKSFYSRLHDNSVADSIQGRAWAIGFNIRQIVSPPYVRLPRLHVWLTTMSTGSLQWWTRHRLGGWDGSGTSDTGGVHCSGEPGLGWVVGTGLGHRAWGWGFEAMDGLGLSDSTSTIQDGPGTSDTEGGGGLRIMEVTLLDSQSRDMTALSTYSRVLLYNTPSPGWVDGMGLGPWLGGRDGPGTSDTGEGEGALVGWMGWAWDILTNLNSTVSLLAHYIGSYLWLTIYRFTTAVDQASAGWFTTAVNQASVGRLGRAWDMDSTPAVQDGPGTSDTGGGGV
ncbi:uncharacterized protein BO96DRAFT_394454 [Aspergillus niger CBS 101883]|uniref:uncharacterized protein n=1 Tax=Aspergillus lacticoffeatus (strain CBS 101883) TaxID=1450533 RepID=UPI000D7FDFA2|nr:uncharacterized protein BO96DRAFT_394454 [Aspergillus niger CBS 101883]PYH56132.1 hypothetical protein BO96DRAFT_394454 [Aspergillus niger CBS 101883]